MFCAVLGYAYSFFIAWPCAADGSFLKQPISKATPPTPNAMSGNPWAPFQDRLAFDWARYHYVWLQSSVDDIREGLDLWHAAVIKHVLDHDMLEGVPWDNAEQLYATIDSIDAGEIGWKTLRFSYAGMKPLTPPQWMEQTYDLNLRDMLGLLEQQLASTEFDGQFEYTPFQEFDSKGDHVYSHLMSAFWANREAVCSLVHHTFSMLTSSHRIWLPKILKHMVQC
jgi:Plavaka transposase